MNKEKLIELSDTLRGIAEGKEWEFQDTAGTWHDSTISNTRRNDPIFALMNGGVRLKPPLDPYAELKAAHAAGKTIQYTDDNNYNGEWQDCYHPFWVDADGRHVNARYRIKPEPRKVPLEPDGIKAGDEFLAPDGSRYQWTHILSQSIGFDAIARTYEALLREGWKTRSIGETEWRDCYKEVSE